MQDRLTTGVLMALMVGAAVALALAGCSGAPAFAPDARRDALDQVTSFGANPGNLNMYRYVPPAMPAAAPLVVALHACTQTAADFQSAGWNQLADTQKFYVVYAEQTATNNSLRCFNWAGVQRGQGEPESIKQMVDQMKADYSIDAGRVFVTGFSAGGVETINLLALYPDVFAAGASLAAVPFDCATTISDASACLSPGKVKTAAEWGTLALSGDPGFAGKPPRAILWHGASDSVVAVANLGELVKQWTDVQGIDATVDSTVTIGSLTHTQYRDAAGAARVETFEVAGLDHAMPVDPTHGCGVAGQYFPDVGICAVREIAAAFGILTGSVSPPDGGAATDDLGALPTGDGATVPAATDAAGEIAGTGGGNDGGTGSTPTAGGCAVTAGAAPLSSGPLLGLVLFVLGAGRFRRRARGAPASG